MGNVIWVIECCELLRCQRKTEVLTFFEPLFIVDSHLVRRDWLAGSGCRDGSLALPVV